MEHKIKVRMSILFAASFSLLGCVDNEQSEQQIVYPTAKVGVTVSSIETNPFFQSAYKAYENEGKENSSLSLILDSAANDQNKQNEQIESMLKNGAQALVINIVNVKDAPQLLDNLCKKRIPAVFFNRSPGDKSLASCDSAYFVDGDAVQAGVLQGLQVLNAWKEHPEWDKNRDGVIQYAMIEGIPGHAGAMARTKWSISTMSSYPELSVPVQGILQDTAMFQTKVAEELMTKWIGQPEFSKVEVILANNDSMALGVISALKEHNISLPVFGIDGSPPALAAVKAGDMAGTVFNDAATQAKTSLRMAANLAAGRPVLEGTGQEMEYQVVKVPYQNITKENIDSFVNSRY